MCFNFISVSYYICLLLSLFVHFWGKIFSFFFIWLHKNLASLEYCLVSGMFFFYNNDNDYDNDDDVGVVSITAAADDDKFNVCYIKRNTTSLGSTENDKKTIQK